MELLKRSAILAGAAVLLVAVGVRPAMAQRGEARGDVINVSDSSLTVQTGTERVTFVVDPSTQVVAHGAGARTRKAEALGTKSGIKVTDYVKTGRPVLVSYRSIDGKNHAITVQPISSAGGGVAPEESTKTAQGKVKTITPTMLTIDHDGRDLMLVVDTNTNVQARGAGKATKNGGVAVTELVHTGDIVSVSYKGIGGTLKATEIRMRGRSTIASK